MTDTIEIDDTNILTLEDSVIANVLNEEGEFVKVKLPRGFLVCAFSETIKLEVLIRHVTYESGGM